MSGETGGTITSFLLAVGQGDERARQKLWATVYDELHEMAAGLMAREPAGHTLQPTALVHEAYARLLGGEQLAGQQRAYFFAAAAQAMRRILIEHARRNVAKRQRATVPGPAPSNATPSPLESLPAPSAGLTAERLLCLDEALDALADQDRGVFDVIMLRFFAGLTIENTAETLNISARTVRRYWTYGRTWLYRRISGAVG